MLLACAGPDVREAPLPELAAIGIDGRLDADEWGASRRFALGDRADLLLARTSGALLIGLRQPPDEPHYADLYVQDADGTIRNFHASMRRGERVLAPGWTDADPPFRWEPPSGWRTNIAEATGAGRDRPFAERVRPHQGYEMEIPFAELGPGPWRVRVELRAFTGASGAFTWPANSVREDPDGWYALTPAMLGAPGDARRSLHIKARAPI